ncbi:kinesin-like protein KIN-14Q [Silene latifolia]|uniref:kinesin-like protein KIN-14Q n=1 Tax=Silene latifolia TaxID=37657 RepID=UPI003D77E840
MGEEEDNPWHDPLLLTDVVSRQSHSSSYDITGVHKSMEIISPRRFCDLFKGDPSKGQLMSSVSLSSPELVMCSRSPDIPKQSCLDSPICYESAAQKDRASSVVLSLEEGIDGVEPDASRDTHDSSKFSSFWHSSKESGFEGNASFELASKPTSEAKVASELADVVSLQVQDRDSDGSQDMEEDIEKLQNDYAVQKLELEEARNAIDELRRENQTRSDECQKALKSLHELQSELMRKSMHVGSLAFAVEGQVKEKSKWFSALRDLKRQLKILKMEQISISEEARKYKICLQDMDEIKSTVQATITQQVAYHDELKMKITDGEKQRKELYNKVLELKGNIRVFCRCRPLHTEEIVTGARVSVDFESARNGELIIRSNGFPRKTYKFDAVFNPQVDQASVFEDTAPFATSVLDGYNVCIFAYGQTGTGKTFTMEGTEEDRGVNYRTLSELFRLINDRKELFRYEICVSVLEVYNEQIRDLLASGIQPAAVSRRLEIRQISEGVHHVPGLVEAHVSNMSEVWDVLKTGSNARAVGSTTANEYSSRSHCMHCVMVKGENLLNGECIKSKLWLVDLAGSERIAKTEAQGERLKEAQNINRSLAALGDVISALANKSQHVPFRNSKLTHLLQDSLGGDSKALMFVQISPNENDLSETLCSLNFANRVKGVELGPAKKQLDNAEFLRYKQLVEKTRQEAKLKDVQIKKMEETVHSLEMRVKEKDQKNKILQEKVKELETQLLVERKLARQHVDTKIAEQQQQHMMQQFEEQNSAPTRPPLVAKTLGNTKNTNDLTAYTPNPSRFLPDHNSHQTPSSFHMSDGFVRDIDFLEKENNPDLGELQWQAPNKTGRASLCPISQQRAAATNTRRNSLIPLPSTPMTVINSNLPLPQPLVEVKEEEREEVELPICSSKGLKRVNSALRRSLQKRIKSPMQQQLRKGGVNVGMEKLRISIGSRGKLGQRVLLGNARRVPTREVRKQTHKDKERGWNF